jgi:succinate dehydrogenase/fumarate reductase-like Fe-S protein
MKTKQIVVEFEVETDVSESVLETIKKTQTRPLVSYLDCSNGKCN